ncbi:MAG: hypothetical protein GF418_03345 [Chitinivibrionales bacterium]|nr:hypothetical protein [Chitinivibrionales bacterium]MBD3394638.1 hypothetical protein [Chitinivibrionales bacterium]
MRFRAAAAPLCALLAGCYSVPHLIWPQKDITSFEVHDPARGAKVLVASRASDFKEAVVARVAAALEEDSAYVKVVGMRALRNEPAAAYDAIVLVNSCMSWAMDRHVVTFVRHHGDLGNVIILTTSADGAWLPRRKKGNYDAIACASVASRADPVSADVLARVRALLDGGS